MNIVLPLMATHMLGELRSSSPQLPGANSRAGPHRVCGAVSANAGPARTDSGWAGLKTRVVET
jgi:hypothetical protein